MTPPFPATMWHQEVSCCASSCSHFGSFPLVCRTVHINCCSSLNKNIETNSHISLSETLPRLLSSQTTLAQLPGLCHGAVIVGGLSVRLQRPEVRHRGHLKAAESQNQNDSNDERQGRHRGHRQGHRQVRRQGHRQGRHRGHRQVRHRVISLRKAQDNFGEQYLSERRRGGIRPIRRH